MNANQAQAQNNQDTEIADTILAQLGRSMGRLSVMIGANTFVARPNGVSFKFKARAKNGSNAIRITLDPSDTYTVEFLSARGTSCKVKASFDDIYCDQLTSLFESETGLYLSLC